MEVTVLCNLITDIIAHHSCHILSVRSKSQVCFAGGVPWEAGSEMEIRCREFTRNDFGVKWHLWEGREGKEAGCTGGKVSLQRSLSGDRSWPHRELWSREDPSELSGVGGRGWTIISHINHWMQAALGRGRALHSAVGATPIGLAAECCLLAGLPGSGRIHPSLLKVNLGRASQPLPVWGFIFS